VGLEGMRYDEVATILRTIRSRLSRGRDQLRKLMGMKEADQFPPSVNLRLCTDRLREAE